jgi:hypothetical protein
MNTTLGISGTRFTINGTLTYSDVHEASPGSTRSARGLLMNARFIQGVFDDAADPARFARRGWSAWDPERHTDELIAALPEWKRHGLLAFTVGFQGGGPFFTTPNHTIHNNPFGPDGTRLDRAYAERMDRLIRAADELGMVVIVSLLYQGQVKHFDDGPAIQNAVITGSRFLQDGGYTNVILEVANEHEVGDFRSHPLVSTGEGMSALIATARRESGGLPTGSSGGGGVLCPDVADASDVVLVHGNGLSRQAYHRFISRVVERHPDKPVVCNEDSECYTRFDVAARSGTSWGYYNNVTKQEPPAPWGITLPEDRFCAWRMANALGIAAQRIPNEEQLVLQGFEPQLDGFGERWPSVASLWPERIDHVEWSQHGKPIDTVYDEPYSLNYRSTFVKQGIPESTDPDSLMARVHLGDGNVVELTVDGQR